VARMGDIVALRVLVGGDPNKRDHLEELVVDGKIILK